ncbi:class I SAM-dependent methyltransferase [Humibacter antri]
MAESFGVHAAAYDRARPRYPSELADRALAETRTASNTAEVLDVGIGTGISAQPFHERGARITGVDADPRMAEFARSRGFDVEVAKFEEWDAAGRYFDLVVAGQTWHWIDPLTGAAKAASVLRGGGRLAVFWNVMQFPPELGAALDAALERHLPGTPFARGISAGLSGYESQLHKASAGIRESGEFGEAERWRFDWRREYGADEWLDGLQTAGGFNRLPVERLEPIFDEIRQAIDDVGGSFTMDYAAMVVTAVRNP